MINRRNLIQLVAGVAVVAGLGLSAFAGRTAVSMSKEAVTGDFDITVIHAIPGLPAPVDVFVNGELAFTFDYRDAVGPLSLPAGSYEFEVQLDGMPVLAASGDFAAHANYTAMAHLTFIDGSSNGIKLSVFENDLSDLDDDDNLRATVRHTADAPAVDIEVQLDGSPIALLEGLENPAKGSPSQAGPVELPTGFYSVTFFGAGSPDPVVSADLGALDADRAYIVYAIGSLFEGSFELYAQIFDLDDDGVGDDDDGDDDDGDDDDGDDDDGDDDDGDDDDGGDDDDDGDDDDGDDD